MGVPRAHSTRAQKGRRRSHLAMTAKALLVCSHCQKPTLPHTVCKYCGFYDGKEVVNVLARELKKQEKKKHQ
ncbi:MAG: 50S ribosomal protein L32 [Patescibacteria group bacterium]